MRPSFAPFIRSAARLLSLALGLAVACALIAPAASAGWLSTLQTKITGNTMETETFNWSISTYGYSIDRKGSGQLATTWNDNWMKDAQGKEVASFYARFSAGWGKGDSPMGGDLREAPLPKTLRLTYYDYQDNKFYQLDAELPLPKLYALFKEKTVSYNEGRPYRVVPRYEDILLCVAPKGSVMVFVSNGRGSDKVELASYQGKQINPGMTAAQYNASRPSGTFDLDAVPWRLLQDARVSPETIAKLKEGWLPDPDWYMRDIRVKFPWRYRLVGNVSRLSELMDWRGNAEAERIRAWEVSAYQTMPGLRGIPSAGEFWFHDKTGQRHRLLLEFAQGKRLVAEDDLSAMRAAFDQMFPGRKLEDNANLPSEQDMGTVEVTVGDDLKTFTAALVKGDVRLPLTISKLRFYPSLQPYAYWDKEPTPSPEEIKLLQNGPQGR